MNNVLIVNKDILKLKQNEGGHQLSVVLKRPVGPKAKHRPHPFLSKPQNLQSLEDSQPVARAPFYRGGS